MSEHEAACWIQNDVLEIKAKMSQVQIGFKSEFFSIFYE